MPIALFPVFLWLLGWLALPLARRVFVGLPDGGLAAGRVLALALLSLLAFWGASLRLVPLSSAPLWLIGGPLLCAALALRHTHERRAFRAWAKSRRGSLAASDLVFVVAFGFFLWLRARHPEINDLEKPMDAALLGSLTRAQFLPPENPWLSGTPFTNYYYFGHLMAALPARVFAAPVPLAYNLAQPAWCALFISSLWSLCAALTGSAWRGVAAMSVVALLGHFEPLRQMTTTQRLWPLNWWDTSRVIPHTINEYPAFTLLIGDLHAHFLALPLAVLFFCLCHALFAGDTHLHAPATDTPDAPARSHPAPGRRLLVLTLMGLTLGVLIMANAWDALTYGLLGVLCALFTSHRAGRTGWRAAILLAWPFLLATIAAWPYLRLFKAPFSGVVWEMWSPPWIPFCLLWGGPLALWGVFLFKSFPPQRTLASGDAIGNEDEGVREKRAAKTAAARRLWMLAALCAALPLFRELAFRPVQDVVALPLVLVFMAFTAVRLRQSFRREDERGSLPNGNARFLLIAGLVGLGALLAPMLFYVRGIFGDGVLRHQDMVFKFGLQAWLLLGVAACGALALWSERESRSKIALSLALLPVPLLCSASVLWTRAALDAPREANEESRRALSLDGAKHLPATDRAALDWLRRHARPGETVLEAASPRPFSGFGRVSALTGIATPLGWPQHLRSWGASEAEIERRLALVKKFYTRPDAPTTRAHLRALGVRYVFAGDLERRTYGSAALSRLRAALPVVYQNGDTFVARVP